MGQSQNNGEVTVSKLILIKAIFNQNNFKAEYPNRKRAPNKVYIQDKLNCAEEYRGYGKISAIHFSANLDKDIKNRVLLLIQVIGLEVAWAYKAENHLANNFQPQFARLFPNKNVTYEKSLQFITFLALVSFIPLH